MFIGIACIMNSVAIIILWMYCDNLSKENAELSAKHSKLIADIKSGKVTKDV